MSYISPIVGSFCFCFLLSTGLDVCTVTLASLVAQLIKNMPAMWEGDLGSIPGSRRSPGEGNGTHSSILAWRIPWAEEPGGL